MLETEDILVATLRDSLSGGVESECVIGISEVNCARVDTGYNSDAVAGRLLHINFRNWLSMSYFELVNYVPTTLMNLTRRCWL